MSNHRTPGSPNWSQKKTPQALARTQAGSVLGVVSSGFVDIDRMTGGFWSGDLIVIGGAPCVGKSALALNISEHVALKQALPVTILSMDMTPEQIAVRLLCSMGRISLDNMRSGRLTDHEGLRLVKAFDELAGSRFVLEYATAIRLDQLTEKVIGISRKCGKQSLVVVDYLQLISDTGRKTGQEQGTDAVLRELKNLATELQCTIIALWQLPSEVESRPNRRPLMSDLGPTDLVERYADVVMLIDRDDIYSAAARLEPGMVEVTFLKRRDGSTGMARLVFLDRLAKYEVLASRN